MIEIVKIRFILIENGPCATKFTFHPRTKWSSGYLKTCGNKFINNSLLDADLHKCERSFCPKNGVYSKEINIWNVNIMRIDQHLGIWIDMT